MLKGASNAGKGRRIVILGGGYAALAAQAVASGELLERIFAAGDCARFAGQGANALSAQIAVRKGKAVAYNLLREGGTGQEMKPYDYAEQGYFVSLGPSDGIGWVGNKENIVKGLSAVAAKKAIEAQYGLILSGIDSYGA